MQTYSTCNGMDEMRKTTAIMALPVPQGPTPKPEGLYNVFTPRNSYIDSEIVLADEGCEGGSDVAKRYPAYATLKLDLNELRTAWDEWGSMPVVVSRPGWFRRGEQHHCIKVYLADPTNGLRCLHDRIVVKAASFDAACRAADSKLYSKPANAELRTYYNAGTIEHYKKACAQLDLIAEGSAPTIFYDNGKRNGPTIVDLRTDRPLNRAIRRFEGNSGSAFWPRSYANWRNELKDLEDLGLDLTTENSARGWVLDIIKRHLAHNRWCARQAENEELPDDTRASMAVVKHHYYEVANRACLMHVLKAPGADF